MNKDNAKDYLPLVQALADGKTIQAALPGPAWWADQPEPGFTSPPQHYRIKPEPAKGWYRVALMRDEVGGTYPLVAREGYPQHVVYVRDGFIRWLTDRIEYEV